jgi:hypothetical protein
MDPETGELEFILTFIDTYMTLFRAVPTAAGEIYCTMSGTARRKEDDSRPSPYFDPYFGVGGVILKINHRRDTMEIVPASTAIQDPCDLWLLSNGHLLVSDFQGFAGTSAVFEIEPSTGDRSTIISGEPLQCSIGAYADEENVYVASSSMHYEYSEIPEKERGNLIRVNRRTLNQDVLVPVPDPPEGMYVGVNGSNDTPYLVVATCDWPTLENGGLIRVNKESGEKEPLVPSTPDKPRFFSPHSEIGNVMIYAADAYQRELLVVDVEDKSVASTHSLSPVLGGIKGTRNPWNVIDCVSIIP